MIKRRKRNFLVASSAVIGIAVLSFTIFFLIKQRTALPPETQIAGVEEESLEMSADLDGDGNLELVFLDSDETSSKVSSIIAYNSLGEIIGSTPEGITFPQPATDSFRVFRLDSEQNKDFFSFDFIAGPHQFERMFFELYEDAILPVCFTEEIKGPSDCLFYMGGPDYLLVEDLDKDGLVEVVEVVDEYPSEGELTEEEKEAIEKEFGELGVSEEAKEIASRESGGRGRPVVWGIYSYDGYYLKPQLDEDHEKYFLILKEEYEDLMRKADLSEDSLEYIEFARNFWTRR